MNGGDNTPALDTHNLTGRAPVQIEIDFGDLAPLEDFTDWPEDDPHMWWGDEDGEN